MESPTNGLRKPRVHVGEIPSRNYATLLIFNEDDIWPFIRNLLIFFEGAEPRGKNNDQSFVLCATVYFQLEPESA